MNENVFIFTDLDFTIIFDSELHPRTHDLIKRVRQQAQFIIVTARSYEEYEPLPPIPNDGLVAENGAVVFQQVNGHSIIDTDWDSRMHELQPVLIDFRDELESEGWIMHHKRHAFSSSVTKSGKSDYDIAAVRKRVPPELKLELSYNTAGTYLEVFPILAGKDKGLQRVCENLEVEDCFTIGMGDNTNDLDMLRIVNLPLAPGNCHPSVRDLVMQQGGFVADANGHEGAWEMLEHILLYLSSNVDIQLNS